MNVSTQPVQRTAVHAGSIIDFSQLNSGLVELALSAFNICDVMENCIDMVHAEAASKGLVVSSTFPREAMTSMVIGDSVRIRQILVHLLSNAVKFTEEGFVELVASASSNGDVLSLTFKVMDTGTGIPESFMPHLFTGFTQASGDCTRVHGGMGLGLAIAHNLAKLMDAKLSLHSEAGAGTTAVFSLQLPIASENSRKNSHNAGVADMSSFIIHRSGERPCTSDLGPPLLDNSASALHMLLREAAVEELRNVTAFVRLDHPGLQRQVQAICEALGMQVVVSESMPMWSRPSADQSDSRPVLFCQAGDVLRALREGWKRRPIVALCTDGHLPHMLRVHAAALATPVRVRELLLAVQLAVNDCPRKTSLLVPLGRPKAASPATCTAGFGRSPCGFCSKCQSTAAAEADAVWTPTFLSTERCSLSAVQSQLVPGLGGFAVVSPFLHLSCFAQWLAHRLLTAGRSTGYYWVFFGEPEIPHGANVSTALARKRISLDNSALEKIPRKLSHPANVLSRCSEDSYTASCASSEEANLQPSTLEYKGAHAGQVGSESTAGSRGSLPTDLAMEEMYTTSNMSQGSGEGNSVAGPVGKAADPSATRCSDRASSRLQSHRLPPHAYPVDLAGGRVMRGLVDLPDRVVQGSQHQMRNDLDAHARTRDSAGGARPAEPHQSRGSIRKSVSLTDIAQDRGSFSAAMQSFLYQPKSGGAAGLCIPEEGKQAVQGWDTPPSAPVSSATEPGQPQPAQALPGSPPDPPGGHARPLRILIAEDNKINQLVTRKVVGKVRPCCEIDVVSDGEAALLTILEKPEYDLVLMDLHMPRMDGLEATRRVRERHPLRPVIVAVTADTVVGTRQKCLAAGMNEYVSKPFHVKDMQRILQMCG